MPVRRETSPTMLVSGTAASSAALTPQPMANMTIQDQAWGLIMIPILRSA